MTIKPGDRLPQATFRVMTAEGPAARSTDDLFAGRRVVLFAVPGAFTPTCHRNHLPGFVAEADAILARGIDAIYVTAVNDIFVMDAWLKASGAEGKITALADGNGEFASAIGLTMDGSGFGLGLRSQRYSMVARDGVVEQLNVEEVSGKADVSTAAHLLSSL